VAHLTVTQHTYRRAARTARAAAKASALRLLATLTGNPHTVARLVARDMRARYRAGLRAALAR